VVESGYVLWPHCLVPQIEQRHLEKDKTRVESQIRTMKTRLVNINRRLAELEEESRASERR
jgi:hypothetical protein